MEEIKLHKAKHTQTENRKLVSLRQFPFLSLLDVYIRCGKSIERKYVIPAYSVHHAIQRSLSILNSGYKV